MNVIVNKLIFVIADITETCKWQRRNEREINNFKRPQNVHANL